MQEMSLIGNSGGYRIPFRYHGVCRRVERALRGAYRDRHERGMREAATQGRGIL